MGTAFHLSVIILLLYIQNSLSQIVLSEIMFNPEGNDSYNEFVELYNLSHEDTVNLENWLISDGDKYNSIQEHTRGTSLLPQQYAVVFVKKYYDTSLLYDNDIPADALQLCVDEASFGLRGFSNSRSETVSIYTPDTMVVSSWMYSVPNPDGYSEEKKILARENTLKNWANSTVPGGTPGFLNSTTPLKYDLAFMQKDIIIYPPYSSPTDNNYISIWVQNLGFCLTTNSTAFLFNDVDGDNLPGINELIENSIVPVLPLQWLDSTLINIAFIDNENKYNDIKAYLKFDNDQNLSNNSVSLIIRKSYKREAVIINEIMYDTDNKKQEWIELYNDWSYKVTLCDWSIRDKKTSTYITRENICIEPGHYCVISHDSIKVPASAINIVNGKLPELNNSGDEIVIMDASGTIIDSVFFVSDWGGTRFNSLERIRFNEPSIEMFNWGSSCDSTGSTPGRENCKRPKICDVACVTGSLGITPEKPSYSDHILAFVEIENVGRQDVKEVFVVFALQSVSTDLFTSLIDTVLIGSINSNEIVNVSSEYNALQPGVYYLLATVFCPGDQLLSNNSITKHISTSYPYNSLVINEIMYSPIPDYSEWIECYNPGPLDVELMDWRFSKKDTLNYIVLSDSSKVLEPGSFFVLARDSSVLEQMPYDAKDFLINRNMKALLNTSDQLVLMDGNGRINDLVKYNSEWGGNKGYSLERIQPNVSSHDISNWTTCVDPKGHTCGTKNSVYIDLLPHIASLSVCPDPFSPDYDGFDDNVCISYILPAKTASVNIKIYDINGRLVRYLVNNEDSGAKRTIIWDGKNDSGQKCRIGIYIICVEALNHTRKTIEKLVKTVVLAGRL